MSIYRYFVALCGCFSFFLFFYLLGTRTAILHKLNLHKLGMIILPIYAIHQTMINRVIIPCCTNDVLEFFTTLYGSIVAFTLVMCSTYIVYYIFKGNKYLSFLFLGINKSSNK